MGEIGSCEPLPLRYGREKSLMFEIPEPHDREGFEFCLQGSVDVGTPTAIVINVDLLQLAHIVVLEGDRLGGRAFRPLVVVRARAFSRSGTACAEPQVHLGGNRPRLGGPGENRRPVKQEPGMR